MGVGGEIRRGGKRGDKYSERKRRKSKKKKNYLSESATGSGSEVRDIEKVGANPEDVVKEMLSEFPNVGGDLKQLLQMIDDGQAVDIKGISERSLIKHLKKLFISLSLKEKGDKVFVLPPNVCPTLEVAGPLIEAQTEHKEQQVDHSVPLNDVDSIVPDAEGRRQTDDNNSVMPSPKDYPSAPRRRAIGPLMPSAELLAAAAKTYRSKS